MLNSLRALLLLLSVTVLLAACGPGAPALTAS